MAGPLSGIGSGQQVPLNQTISQGQNNYSQLRAQEDRKPEANRVQPQNAAAADTQSTNTEQDFIQQQLEEFAAGEASNITNQNERERGSLVDISV